MRASGAQLPRVALHVVVESRIALAFSSSRPRPGPLRVPSINRCASALGQEVDLVHWILVRWFDQRLQEPSATHRPLDGLLATLDHRTGTASVARPCADEADAEGLVRPVRGSPVVKLPLDAHALARPVARTHAAARGARAHEQVHASSTRGDDGERDTPAPAHDFIVIPGWSTMPRVPERL